MTRSQERALKKLEMLTRKDFLPNEEMKTWEVKDIGTGTLSVVIEYGLVNDEGTLAEIFARSRCHIFIGSRGGVSYYNNKGTRKRFKWYSILQAVVEQRI